MFYIVVWITFLTGKKTFWATWKENKLVSTIIHKHSHNDHIKIDILWYNDTSTWKMGRMSSRWTNQPFEGPDVATPWGPNHYCHVTRHTVLRVWNRGYQSPFGPDRLERILIDVACLAYSHIVSIAWLLKVILTSFNKSANFDKLWVKSETETPDCDSIWFKYQKHTIGLPARPAGGWKNLPGFDPHHYTIHPPKRMAETVRNHPPTMFAMPKCQRLTSIRHVETISDPCKRIVPHTTHPPFATCHVLILWKVFPKFRVAWANADTPNSSTDVLDPQGASFGVPERLPQRWENEKMTWNEIG